MTHVEEKFVLKDLQRIWGTMISEFRVFMAFRTGTFGRPEVGMPVYSKNVVLLHNEITKKLDVVKSLIDDEQVGFTAESSYEVMTDASREWREIFDRVRTIQSSDKWRMDTVIIEDEIRPISRAIQQQLSELDAYAAQTYQTALGDFDRATTLIGRIIIFIPLLVIAFMVTGFLYFRRQVIKPIAQMSHTMRDETVGDRAFTGHESDASEISDLFLAFNTMNKRIEERETHLKYLVLHDRMTGLPNREFMRKKMGELLEQPDASFAFLLIGVDRFKEVNDCYGYKVGDQVLSHISNILQSEYQQVAFIARIGSDEYGLLMINGNETSARKLAANIHAQLALPIKTNSHLVSISVSIGISIYPEHGHSVDSIMSRAVIALQHAKQDHSIVNVYTTDRDLNSETRLKVIDELRYAIEHDKLEVEYQPQVSLKDGKVIGFEVLSRLPTMKHHNMTTQELIELAEQTGLIHQLTEWVLQSVFKHCSAWPEGNKQLSVGVNLSMASFHNPSLIDTIKAGMSSWKLPGNNLKLEITESLMMGDPQQAKRLLNEFHNMGVKISIDDFGTGYSSLNYLTDLMVHELKIDRSFIASMESSDKHRAIVKTIINIADNLGVEVVAEGVETREQYEMVRALGCYAAQGYYISTSIPEDEVEGWLDSGKWQAVS